MSPFWLFVILCGFGIAGFMLTRGRAMHLVAGDARKLHSRPGYYGWAGFMAAAVPGLIFLIVAVLAIPLLTESRVAGMIPDSMASSAGSRTLVMSEVRRVAAGLDTALDAGILAKPDLTALSTTELAARLKSAGVTLMSEPSPEVMAAATRYSALNVTYGLVLTGLILALAAVGLALALARTTPEFRARNTVERGIRALLIAAASIAILTTLGIVMSMLFETRNFFSQYPVTDFLFGVTWSPDFRGNSQLGILPLLWGTLYISFIALVVAVPIGLFAAIYLSEYAGSAMRAAAKPLIEILAGIPTIVYGLFALITVGPMLRDYLAKPMGLGDSGSSVLTAGLVMGVMLIPFVSSLSDDIINAVPQSMRDGSLGLGATRSETIRQVVVPAALPGIVGAILLAASRAIGETMIVVMGAGAAAAQMTQGLGEIVNPFKAMTTVTVKIVSQLTGDTDFASPETLVAFALGLTLFVITLALNVLALYIVRKYREQYE